MNLHINGCLAAVALVAVLLPACGSGSSASQPGSPDASPEAGLPDDAGQPSDAGQPTEAGQPDQVSPPDAGVAVAQAGGSPSAIALIDHWAYITIGPRLTIWDVTTPSTPSLRGETAPFDGILDGVAVAGTLAYVTEAQDLDGLVRVVDVTDPTTPSEVTSFHLGTTASPVAPRGVGVIGQQLFVGGDTGIWVFDLTNPRAPAPVKSISSAGASHFRLVGKRLYYWGNTLLGDVYLGALDTSANLADLGGAIYTGALGADVAAGDMVIVTSGGGTQVFDATNPKNPGSPLFSSQTQSRTVAASGPVAWVPAWDGLHVLDLSNPKSISDSGRIAMPSEGVNDVAVLGSVLGVVTDRGRLLAIDVTQPRAPVSKAVVDISLCADCIGVQAAGGDLFIGAGSAGLRTGRLSDLTELGGAYPFQYPSTQLDFEGIVVEGNIAYVADWYQGGLRIYDVSAPASPKQLSQLAGGFPAAIAYSGGRVYLGQNTNGGVFAVVDVSDPTHPAPLGSVKTTGALGVAVRSPLAFVADSAGGLQIFDVSNPASIKTVGHYGGCSAAHGVALSGNVAAVACDDGFHFVDVSNPAAPVKKSMWAPKWPGSSAAVAASGTRVYLGHNDGVTVVDLADPTAPNVLDQRPTSFAVRSLTLSAPDHVIATCGSGGVYQWDFSSR